MRFEVRYGPAYALGVGAFDAGEQIQAEGGTMVSMSDGIEIETQMRGGLLSGLRRSVQEAVR
jgi:uncharacterized protein (AIM24 family)